MEIARSEQYGSISKYIWIYNQFHAADNIGYSKVLSGKPLQFDKKKNKVTLSLIFCGRKFSWDEISSICRVQIRFDKSFESCVGSTQINNYRDYIRS